jgi:hypothetical protein
LALEAGDSISSNIQRFSGPENDRGPGRLLFPVTLAYGGFGGDCHFDIFESSELMTNVIFRSIFTD